MKTITKEEKRDFLQLCQTMIKSCTNQFSADVSFFIACQFALESNFGTSNLALNNNNISGMRHPLVRLTNSQQADKNGFATYRHISDCIFDYLLCLNYHQIGVKECESIGCFAKFISKWYCPSRDYYKRINSIYVEYSLFSNYSLNLNFHVTDD